MEFFAYFREHRQEKLHQLYEGMVVWIESTKRGQLAWVKLVEGGDGFRFWISQEDNPSGAICRPFLRNKASFPTISRKRINIPVSVGTKVLLFKPVKGISAFPVVLLQDYEQTMLKDARAKDGQNHTRKKGDHRWVDHP